jgi:hypothetical protein
MARRAIRDVFLNRATPRHPPLGSMEHVSSYTAALEDGKNYTFARLRNALEPVDRRNWLIFRARTNWQGH